MDFNRRSASTTYHVACPNCQRTIDVVWTGREFHLSNRECWNCGRRYIQLFHMSKPGEVHPTLLEALRPGVEARKRTAPTAFDYKVKDHVTGRTSDQPAKGDGRDYKGHPKPTPFAGYVQDVAIFNRALTRKELAEIKTINEVREAYGLPPLDGDKPCSIPIKLDPLKRIPYERVYSVDFTDTRCGLSDEDVKAMAEKWDSEIKSFNNHHWPERQRKE